jgi:hypothetical protein
MNPYNKAINMVLRGDLNKFKNIMEEALRDRAAALLEQFYYKKAENILNDIEISNTTEAITNSVPVPVLEEYKILSVYTTKDGNTVELNEEQVESVSKLYKNLNNSNKERLIKLLSESVESINRILNLAKLQRNNNGK